MPAGLGLLATPFVGLSLGSQTAKTSTADQSSPGQKGAGKPAEDQTRPTIILRTERNLVLVPVVVRDAKGNLVDNLTQKDFRVFDNGKPQQITDFSILRANSGPAATPPEPAAPERAAPQPAKSAPGPAPPHFIAFYFDDIHLAVESAVPVRAAAQKFLTSSWRPGDYGGVFTATGQTDRDFTSDLGKVQDAVARIMARPSSRSENDCPDISPYQSYLIVGMNDRTATDIANQESIKCNCIGDAASDIHCVQGAITLARMTAEQVWEYTQHESQATLREIEGLIERMANLPGERTLTFVSPGLLTAPNDLAVAKLIDLGIRDRVTVNSLEARGLFVIPNWEHTSRVSGPRLAQKLNIIHTEATAVDAPLAELAEGTGGTFFHDDNDLVAGFKEATSLPGVEYLLGFSPENLKENGSFHSLKVQIVLAGSYQVQARKGYIAPTKGQRARENPPDPIETALYSGSPSQAFPIGAHTESGKAEDGRETLTVAIHVEIQNLDFREKKGHFRDTLVFRTALFDSREQCVVGSRRNLDLDLDENKLTILRRSGVNAIIRLAAPPGEYVLREVVEEKSTGKLSALSQRTRIQ